MPRRYFLLALVTVVLLCASLARGQTWTYQGSSMCYQSGTVSQCFSSGQLQQYTSSRTQFDNQFAAGQAIGQGIGALLNNWAEHRRQVNLERKDLRGQISAYYDAAFELIDEIVRQDNRQIDAYARLAVLSPSNSDQYKAAIAEVTGFRDQVASIRTAAEKNVPVIVGAKNVPYLQQNVETARKMYEMSFKAAQRGFVFTQFMEGLIGFYEYQQGTPASPGRVQLAANQSSAEAGPGRIEQAVKPSPAPKDLFVWFDESAPGPGAPLFEVLVTARAYDGALAILRQARQRNTSVQAGTSVLDTNYHPSTVSLDWWQKSNPDSAPSLFYWQGEEVNGAVPVMHFQMTKRAYEQMLALVAGSDLRVRPSQASNQNH